MNSSLALIGIFICAILLFGAIAILVTRYRMKRIILSMINTFRNLNAVNSESARTAAELGVEKKGLFSFKLLRDYKPMALQTLVGSGIIKVTPEGKLYLSEETLSQSNLKVN